MPDPLETALPQIRSHPAYRWVRTAALLATFLYLDREVYLGWVRGEYTIRVALIYWWWLLPPKLAILWGAVPDALYPAEYPPATRWARGKRRWTVVAPGVSFGCVFPGVALAIAAVFTAVRVSTADGRLAPVAEIAGFVGGGIALAAVIGLLLRTSPRLDVDEERRELTWQPGSIAGTPLTLPFDAVVTVDVADTPAGQHHPEITWRTGTGEVATTRLPAGASRELVENVVTCVRAAIGLTAARRR